jgi:nitrate reductase NapE component
MSALEPLRPGGEQSVWYAYAYLSLLVLLPLLSLAVALYTGLVTLEATLTVSPDLSTPAEWLAQGLVVVFLLWTFIQIVRVTGVGFIEGLVQSLARIADAYELPGEPEQAESLAQSERGDEAEGQGGEE